MTCSLCGTPLLSFVDYYKLLAASLAPHLLTYLVCFIYDCSNLFLCPCDNGLLYAVVAVVREANLMLVAVSCLGAPLTITQTHCSIDGTPCSITWPFVHISPIVFHLMSKVSLWRLVLILSNRHVAILIWHIHALFTVPLLVSFSQANIRP